MSTTQYRPNGPFSAVGQSRIIFACLLLTLVAAVGRGQQTKPSEPPSQGPDDVIRVSTKLVQTGVTVVDKKGKFIDNLSRNDFEIRVDGKPQPISLFEIIRSTAPSRGSGAQSITPSSSSISPDGDAPGRSVIFFIDDRHLAPDSVLRTRKMIEYYIDKQMGSDDQVLIASTSGQIGFLQQFTDSKDALRAAAARLNYRSLTARDTERPPMSEYQALTIERGDEPMLTHFVSFVWREQFVGMKKVNPAVARGLAEKVVHERARRILRQSDIIATGTLATLENLTKSVAQLPGRKLIVLVSDGFLQSSQASGVSSRLRDITDAALRGDTVIYSLQGSGLGTVFPDAANWDVLDENGDTGRAPLGEDFALQAPLYQLAEVTGGRALFNTNDLSGALTQSLDETSQYYLLAWRPDDDLVRERKFHRIKVVLKAHPELSARMNRGFFSAENTSASEAAAKAAETNAPPQEQLRATISKVFHNSSLRTNLSVTYMESPAGPKLTILMQVPVDGNEPAGQIERAADIVGVVLDDQGKVAGSFGDHLTAATVTASESSTRRRSITYLNQVIVKPGLYQVRVAARDTTSGNIGRALRWIEVPNVSSGKLSLSSLLLGERDTAVAPNTNASQLRAQLKVDNHFNRKGRLRMLMYFYNASSAGGSNPQIDVELQLLRQNRVLVSTPPRKLDITSEDVREFPFMEELSLAQLSSGRYVLRVIATDRLSKKSISREAAFQVE